MNVLTERSTYLINISSRDNICYVNQVVKYVDEPISRVCEIGSSTCVYLYLKELDGGISLHRFDRFTSTLRALDEHVIDSAIRIR